VGLSNTSFSNLLEITLKIKIGDVARELREQLEISQKNAADALGITQVHLCNIEKDKSKPSSALLERYRELWGIDLYVFAWCRHGNVRRLPPAMRDAAVSLAEGWNHRIRDLILARKRGT
jgi:transcriptional regulator with XRE-family HTH domain